MRTTVVTSLILMLALTGSAIGVTAQSEPSASPSATASPGADPVTEPGEMTLAFEAPAWERVTSARGPDAREDHTWTVDSDGRFAYLFGGRDGGNDFGDLWRFDLDADRWERLSSDGRTPQPRFGHSAVWVDGLGLVIFAGQRGTDFFGDLWVFDPDRGRWQELPANGAEPRPRYGSCMVVGRDGRIWISHGFTFAGRFDDTRAYNLNTRRWASIAPDGRRPGERCLHDCFTSASGELVLYGGQDNSERALGDLWATRRNGSWRKLDAPRLKARRLYGVTEAGDYAYIFGGAGKDDGVLDDLWRVDRDSLEFQRVRVDGSGPAARSAGTLITDPARGRLLLFGGKGSGGARNDMWELTDTASVSDEAMPSAVPDASSLPDASADAAS